MLGFVSAGFNLFGICFLLACHKSSYNILGSVFSCKNGRLSFFAILLRVIIIID